MDILTIYENGEKKHNYLEWAINLKFDARGHSDRNFNFSIMLELYLENVRRRIINALQLSNEDNLGTIASDVAGFVIMHADDEDISYNIISYQLTMLFMKVSYCLDIQNENGKIFDWLSVDALKTIGIRMIEEKINETLLSMFNEADKKRSKYNTLLIEKCKEYMRKNLYEDLSLVNVAGAMAIHPNYLSKIFKETTGTNFIRYMTTLKIREAKRLLEDSSLRVNEIADRLNYHDNSYFSKKFKNTVGVLPTEYRRLIV